VSSQQSIVRPAPHTVELLSHEVSVLLYPDRTQYFLGRELYLLLLIRGARLSGDDLMCGLVIEPVDPRSYRRTGYFELWGEGEIEGALDAQKGVSYVDKFLSGRRWDPIRRAWRCALSR